MKRHRPPPRTGFSRGGQPPRRSTGNEKAILYGYHSVIEALRNPKRRFRHLLATENGAQRLIDDLGELPIEPEIVLPRQIASGLTPDAVHQGMLLVTEPLESPRLEDIEGRALVLVLDQITDPHNVGAIVRTAAAFAVDAIVTTERHSPEATGVLAKAASGGLEHVPIVLVRNLADALEKLGKSGFQRIGLDSAGEAPLTEVALARPLALVLGAEGKGLRQRTRENCDGLARLDVPGAIKSLNVSNAAAIALFQAVAATGGTS